MLRRAALSLALILASTAAHAETLGACDGPHIHLDGSLAHAARWSLAARSAESRVTVLPDVDECAVLDVSQRAGKTLVHARAGDGRATERQLSGPDELEPTAIALLVLPPPLGADDRAPPAPAAKPPEASRVAVAEERAPPAAARPARPPEAPASLANERSSAAPAVARAQRSSHAFDLAAGARAEALGQVRGPGAEVAFTFARSGWLFGAGLAFHHLTGTSGKVSARTGAKLAPLFGRRLSFGRLDLDFLLEAPALSFESNEWSETSSTPQMPVVEGDEPGETEEDAAEDDDDFETPTSGPVTSQSSLVESSLDLSAGVGLRASVPLAGPLRAYGAVNGEYALRRWPLGAEAIPVLPAFGFGVSVGVLWSAP